MNNKTIQFGKQSLAFLVILLSLTLTHAMNVSVVIQFPSQTEIYLVNVSSNATAKDALIATGLETNWSYGGSFLDCISGVCGSGSRNWWCFTYKENEKWVFSNVGLKAYKCKDQGIIGLRFLQGEDSSICFKCFSGCDYKIIQQYCAPSQVYKQTARKEGKPMVFQAMFLKLLGLFIILIIFIKILNYYQKR